MSRLVQLSKSCSALGALKPCFAYAEWTMLISMWRLVYFHLFEMQSYRKITLIKAGFT